MRYAPDTRMEEAAAIEPTAFTAMLIEANGLDRREFKNWAFYPGMLFNSPDKWWGDYGRRDFPHEGIDFCLYEDHYGSVRHLGAGTDIPVMHSGVVKALFKDYLGLAIIIEHESKPGRQDKLLSVYAHTQPRRGIGPGVFVKTGESIATIADTRRSKAKILPHLHVSFGIPSPELVYEPFVWDSIRDPRQVELLDPQTYIGGPCQVLEFQNIS